MKIVHFVYSLEMGGAEVLVAQLCRLQRAQGHDVHVFAYSQAGVLGEALRSEGFEVYVPGEAHPTITIRRYYKRLRMLRPDVAHAHNTAPTIQGAISARLARVPVVVSTLHSLGFAATGKSSERKYRFSSRFCDRMVGICDATCRNLVAAGIRKEKVARVYNGASPLVPSSEVLPKTPLTILFVGRLAPEKQLTTLIAAVSLAKKYVPEIRLWLVGDGRSRQELEAYVQELGAQEYVTFWGQQVNPAPYFLAADVFAMTSFTEGLPMSLLQAMSAGLPSVLTDVGGMGEVVRMSRGGLLAPVGDADQIAEALVRLAREPDLRSECARNARASYEAEFTLEHMTAAYSALYTDAART